MLLENVHGSWKTWICVRCILALDVVFPSRTTEGTINYVTAYLHNRKQLKFTITMTSVVNCNSSIVIFGGRRRKTKDS